MSSSDSSKATGDLLLEMRGLRIEGQSGEEWLEIIKGIDITLNRGEVLGLIGESGAGKSTAGLAAMGYVHPGCRIIGGSIIFDGIDLLAVSEEERRKLRGVRIAYVAQSAAASFNPAHKLIDQFAEILVKHGKSSKEQAEADAKDLYGRLLLPDPDGIGFRYPHQVSGGQLQRAMTAMALSCRPDLIIFDEPTHGSLCHDPDRGAGHHSRHRRSVPYGSHLHYPRPGRGGADVGQDHGSSIRRSG